MSSKYFHSTHLSSTPSESKVTEPFTSTSSVSPEFTLEHRQSFAKQSFQEFLSCELSHDISDSGIVSRLEIRKEQSFTHTVSQVSFIQSNVKEFQTGSIQNEREDGSSAQKLSGEVETVLSADSILSMQDVKTFNDGTESVSPSKNNSKDLNIQTLLTVPPLSKLMTAYRIYLPAHLPKPIAAQYLSLHLKEEAII